MIITEPSLIQNGPNKGKIGFVSSILLEIECDECHTIFKRLYGNRVKCYNKHKRDLCINCTNKFAKDKLTGKTYEEIYGEEKAEEMRFKAGSGNRGKKSKRKNKNYIQQYGEERAKEIKNKISITTKNVMENNIKFNEWKNKKTYEEKYGEEKAEEIKNKVSCNKLNKTYEEIYGEEKAKNLKINLSNKFSGKNNPMYGKPAPLDSGTSYVGKYKNILFRSFLELSFIMQCLKNNISIKNAEYIKIPYTINNINRNYLPDFIINNNTIIEIKPSKDLSKEIVIIKKIAAINFCKNNNLLYKILTEININELSRKDLINLYNNKEIQLTQNSDKRFHLYILKDI